MATVENIQKARRESECPRDFVVILVAFGEAPYAGLEEHSKTHNPEQKNIMGRKLGFSNSGAFVFFSGQRAVKPNVLNQGRQCLTISPYGLTTDRHCNDKNAVQRENFEYNA